MRPRTIPRNPARGSVFPGHCCLLTLPPASPCLRPNTPPNLCQHLLLPQCLISHIQARSAPSLPSLRKTEVSPLPCRTHPALSSPGFLDSTDSLSGEGAREEVPQPRVGSCELFSNVPVAPCPMSTIMFKASWSLPAKIPGALKQGESWRAEPCQTNGAR